MKRSATNKLKEKQGSDEKIFKNQKKKHLIF